MAHATATIKSTTAKATIKLGQGVDVKVELDAADVKESFA
ncbi:hypothetical protein Pint_03715 [Pistacia integerrima]|nr:hypothetical protein Pint_03715 [Pistacia integerrima]